MNALVGLSMLEYLALRARISDLKSELAKLQRIQLGHAADNHFALAAGTSDLIREALQEAEKAQQILDTLSLGENNED